MSNSFAFSAPQFVDLQAQDTADNNATSYFDFDDEQPSSILETTEAQEEYHSVVNSETESRYENDDNETNSQLDSSSDAGSILAQSLTLTSPENDSPRVRSSSLHDLPDTKGGNAKRNQRRVVLDTADNNATSYFDFDDEQPSSILETTEAQEEYHSVVNSETESRYENDDNETNSQLDSSSDAGSILAQSLTLTSPENDSPRVRSSSLHDLPDTKGGNAKRNQRRVVLDTADNNATSYFDFDDEQPSSILETTEAQEEYHSVVNSETESRYENDDNETNSQLDSSSDAGSILAQSLTLTSPENDSPRVRSSSLHDLPDTKGGNAKRNQRRVVLDTADNNATSYFDFDDEQPSSILETTEAQEEYHSVVNSETESRYENDDNETNSQLDSSSDAGSILAQSLTLTSPENDSPRVRSSSLHDLPDTKGGNAKRNQRRVVLDTADNNATSYFDCDDEQPSSILETTEAQEEYHSVVNSETESRYENDDNETNSQLDSSSDAGSILAQSLTLTSPENDSPRVRSSSLHDLPDTKGGNAKRNQRRVVLDTADNNATSYFDCDDEQPSSILETTEAQEEYHSVVNSETESRYENDDNETNSQLDSSSDAGSILAQSLTLTSPENDSPRVRSSSLHDLPDTKGGNAKRNQSADNPKTSTQGDKFEIRRTTSNSSSLNQKLPTVVRPFSFEERNKQLQMKKEQMVQKVLEAEKKAREFHARPPVGLYAKPFVPKKMQIPLTEFSHFQLNTELRARDREQFDKNLKKKMEQIMALQERLREEEENKAKREIAVNRKHAEFKAQPVRHYKNIEKPATKPMVTVPVSPDFAYKHLKNKKN